MLASPNCRSRRLALALLAAVLTAGTYPIAARSDDSTPSSGRVETSSTKSNTVEERMALLEETIRALEARIRELEGHPAAAPPANVASAAGEAAKAAPAPPVPAVGNKASFFDKVTFSGLVDTYYGFNFNRPQSRNNQLRNFDINHNQFSLNLLEFAMERQADPIGFRVDFDFGDTAKMVAASEPGGTNLYQYLQQAYVTYKAPLGKGLTIDFGKFVTPLGAEVIETPANYNYSRSLLFSWAIPYYHFGARLSYPISDKLAISAMAVNGWNDVVDNNGGKTGGLSVTYTPRKNLSVVQNYIVGAEQPGNGHDRRHVLDTVATLGLGERLSLMANYDYGMDRVAGSRARYQGIAAYARYAFTPRFSLSPRMEWFTDPQGLATGLVQTLKEATLTSEFKLRQSMLVRAEFRRDWSDRPFFEKRSGILAHTQTTATLGLIYVMGQEP